MDYEERGTLQDPIKGTHIGDHGVAIVARHKVLDCTWRSIFQLVAADEVVCESVSSGIGGSRGVGRGRLAIRNGNGAIGVWFDPVGLQRRVRHGVCCFHAGRFKDLEGQPAGDGVCSVGVDFVSPTPVVVR